MKPKFPATLLVLLLVALPLSAQNPQVLRSSIATIPSTLSYQGVLDSAGTPLTGSRQMMFKLYDVSTGGDPVWMETQNVPVSGGIFNVLLGSDNPLSSLAFDAPYWLEVTISGSDPLGRIELSSSAYSFRAAYANNTQFAIYADTSQFAQTANSVSADASLAVRKISAYNDQGTSVGSFSLDNATSNNDALVVHTFGHGDALYVEAHSDGNAINAKAGGPGYAGYFQGNLHVAGTLSKAGGSFEIDHPLDPANKILRHSFVESPDMMNIYNGNVNTNGLGLATIQLPDYFEALNKDFRYQLTVIGRFAQAVVLEEIQDNRFTIQTDQPNVKVSWQVTGVRKDRWAEENRIVVEETKSQKQ